MITVTPADVQNPDAARDVFWRLRLTQPQITPATMSGCPSTPKPT